MIESSTPITADFETQGGPAADRTLLSIVVPTFKRPILLERLLVSLLGQTASPDCFEVIVVDNSPSAPDAATQALCREERFRGLRLRSVHQPEPGASAARNLGIAQAHAALLGFADDDEILETNWVERALAIQAERHPDVFGGVYQPYYREDKPAWFRDAYMRLHWGDNARILNPGEYLFGGNMFFQREWLERSGGFSTTIGRVGLNMEYGEETELQQRTVALGARLWYDPSLVIYHYTHPDRMRVRWFLSSAWYHGKAKALLALSKQPEQRRSPMRILLGGLRGLLSNGLRLAGLAAGCLARDRKAYPYAQNYWVEVLAPKLSGWSAAFFTMRFLLAPQRAGLPTEAKHA